MPESDGSTLALLEERLTRLLSRFSVQHQEIAELRQTVQELLKELEVLRQKNLKHERIVERLKDERLEIRSRLVRIEQQLNTLEAPIPASSL